MAELLEQAQQQFDLCKDYSRMGDCQLGLAQLRRDKKLLEEAYKNFGTTQPFPNVAGMLECVKVRKCAFVPDVWCFLFLRHAGLFWCFRNPLNSVAVNSQSSI